MPEPDVPVSPTPDAPLADLSPDALAAAFADAKPYSPEPPPVAAPVDAAVPAAETAPATESVPSSTPAAVEVAAPDYTAYLKETFGVDAPEVLKEKLTLAEQAEQLQANQRTAQDVAFSKLLEDPAAATAFVKLQTTDFTALSPRERLAAAYAHAHPELPAELAALEADEEYTAKFAAAEFDDPDDPAVRAAKLRLDYADKQALQTLEQAKTAAREAVLTKATPAAEGPSAAQQAAQARQEAISHAWEQGIEHVLSAPSLELAYTVDGQDVKLAFDHKAPAFQAFVQNPIGWLEQAIGFDPQNPSATNFERLAEIGAWLTQPDVMLKNTLSAGKAALGPVIPLAQAVNPVPTAAPTPAGLDGSHDARVAAALRDAMSTAHRATYL